MSGLCCDNCELTTLIIRGTGSMAEILPNIDPKIVMPLSNVTLSKNTSKVINMGDSGSVTSTKNVYLRQGHIKSGVRCTVQL